MSRRKIPFTKPDLGRREATYVQQALASGHLSGDGPFTGRCHAWLEAATGAPKALLTHSCTAALEMAALALDLAAGDEVIMPSFTFTSTANAFALRGARPVFVDIRADTLNLDERLVEDAITPRTKAIAPVHYAGVGCAMDEIMRIAGKHGLRVIEDAAQCLNASYRGRRLGSIGDIGALSFHQTKNIVSGEGGALLVNRADLAHRAEIIREKGTDRSRFLRGEVDKYTWQELGSSYLPSELIAACLLAQLENAAAITAERLKRWHHYHAALEPLEIKGLLRRPTPPRECDHNGHIYQILLAPRFERDAVLSRLRAAGVGATFHYVPLHSTPAGQRYGRANGGMENTVRCAASLIRLPLWDTMSEDEQAITVDELTTAIDNELDARTPD